MAEGRFSVLSEFTCHNWFSGADMKNEQHHLKQVKAVIPFTLWRIRRETDKSGIKDVEFFFFFRWLLYLLVLFYTSV